MKVLSFYLKAKMAHFRRFYSNSSSLTYSIPPRTTICGIIAGLMGYERDSYYEIFSRDNCGITVAPKSKIKKLVQTVNLLKVENRNELNGSSGFHTRTATEMIMPYDIKKQNVSYQVWFSHNDNSIMDEMRKILCSCQPAYQSRGISMALGTAYNLGWIEYVGEFEGKKLNGGNISAQIMSAIPQKIVKNIEIKNMINTDYRLIREEIPLEFDSNRCITKGSLCNMIFDLNGNPIPVVIDKCIELSNGETISWME